MVSYLFFEDGDIAPIINVLVLPINDYWSRRVSFDSLKIDEFFTMPFESSLMTLPRVVKERLIFFNYYRC